MPGNYRRVKRNYRATAGRGRRTYSKRHVYRRSYKTKYRAIRKKTYGRKFAGRNQLSLPTTKKHVILEYVNSSDVPYMVIPTGAPSGYGQINLALNDLNFPMRSINGTPLTSPTTMAMKAEWADWYKRWKVHMVEISFTVINPTVNPFYIGIYTEPQTKVLTPAGLSYQAMMTVLKTNPYNTYKLVGPVGQQDCKATVSLRVPIAKFLGSGEYRTDPLYEGGNGASFNISPTNLVNGTLIIANVDGSSPGADFSVPINIKMNFFVQMYSRDDENN